MIEPARPLWREPVTWIAIGLPLLTIFAAVVTIRMAQESSTVAEVSAVQRIAQVQFEDLAPDSAAARLGLSAKLSTDHEKGVIEVLLLNPFARSADHLLLTLRHPLDAGKDRTLSLQWDGDRWRGKTAPWAAQSWNVKLTDEVGSWRLTGSVPKDGTTTTLIPAVSQ